MEDTGDLREPEREGFFDRDQADHQMGSLRQRAGSGGEVGDGLRQLAEVYGNNFDMDYDNDFDMD